MRITIVTVVRDAGATLPDALRSLAAQTHRDIDHVVQDGGSRDGTRALLRGLGGPGMRLRSGRDRGIYDALNAGIARARGEVVGLLHGDDRFADAQVLAEVAACFEDPSVDGVYGDLEYLAGDGSGRVIRHWRAGAFAPGKLRRGWMPPHPTLFLRRRVLVERGLYDASFRIAGDYEAMLRWLAPGDLRLVYLPRVLVRMRAGGTSNRDLRHLWRKSREDLRALRMTGTGGPEVLLAKILRKLPQLLHRAPRVRSW